MNETAWKCGSLKISYKYMDVWWCIYFSLCFQVSSPPNFDVAHLEGYPDNEMFILFYDQQLFATISDLYIQKMVRPGYVLTLYSFLNPALSFADMFEICAFMFLTEIFLLVGGPRFVFSGNAYVVHEVLLVCSIS